MVNGGELKTGKMMVSGRTDEDRQYSGERLRRGKLGGAMANDQGLEEGHNMVNADALEDDPGVVSGIELEDGGLLASDDGRPPMSELRTLYETRVSVQKLRIAIGNRSAALARGVDEADAPVPGTYARLTELAHVMEHEIDRAMPAALASYPVWDAWLSHVRGIGPALAGQMLALLLPPLPDRGPSTWYKAAGLVPQTQEDGTSRLERPRKGGGKIEHHRGLRKCLYLVGESFVRGGGYYREVYDERKVRLFRQHCPSAARLLEDWHSTGVAARARWLVATVPAAALAKARGTESLESWASEPSIAKAVALAGVDDETWPLWRVDRVARWATVRLFLSHLWEQWCEVEGIERRAPYIVEYGRHHWIPAPLPQGGKKI